MIHGSIRIIIVSSLLFLGFPLSAQERYETTQLFSWNQWSVMLTYDTVDDGFWCSAETTNSTSQTFSITTHDDGAIALFVFDYSWNIEPRLVSFMVDIDYSRWYIDGQATGSAVSVFISDPTNAINFLEQLAAGSAVAILNDAGSRLAVFSLRGSSASITNLMECWDRILDRDPFQNSADPF